MNGLTMSDQYSRMFMDGIRSNQSLLYLNLAKNDLTGNCFKFLAPALQSDFDLGAPDKRLSGLLDLDLSNNNLSDSGLRKLCLFLGDRQNQLQRLNVSNCRISPAAANDLFDKIGRRCATLKQLNIRKNKFD